MNNDHMKSHLQPHQDQYDYKIMDLLSHIGESIEEAHEHNAGLQFVIQPDDIHELYIAFKAKGLL